MLSVLLLGPGLDIALSPVVGPGPGRRGVKMSGMGGRRGVKMSGMRGGEERCKDEWYEGGGEV